MLRFLSGYFADLNISRYLLLEKPFSYPRVGDLCADRDGPDCQFLSTISAMLYQYQPLNKENREFRLLQLLPLRRSPEEAVRCRMKHVRLEGHKVITRHDTRRKLNVKYEAISYCWGDPIRSRSIRIDGKILHLPVNSDKALRRMALSDRSRLLFLDAVCVNQENLGERTTQVRLMGDIYRHAQCTLVHLGDAVNSTAQAFADIRLLNVELQQEAQARGGMRNVFEGSSDRKHGFKSSINEDALVELTTRPWFT